jgi:8-oxo-dGTP pyrophosphatase MutT (NUDIX family)
MPHIWKPSVTVAAVVDRTIVIDGIEVQQFLMVEEETFDGLRYNQPAGHLEAQESLLQAVVREALEETAYDFEPTGFIGSYLSHYVSKRTGVGKTYLRFAFAGKLGQQHDLPLDEGIVRSVWMSYPELQQTQERHRGPMVLQCVDDFLARPSAPLDLLFTHSSIFEQETE